MKRLSRSDAEIVVAKKKLDAIRQWMSKCERHDASRVMLLEGPSGSGKSAAVRLVAAEADREVHEWRAPVPTLWDDLRYNNIPSSSYSSKVDEFVAFIARAFRYSPLDLRLDPLENKEHQEIIQNQSNLGQKTLVKGCGGKHSKTSKNVILLIEDIPFVNNVDQSNQVHRILQQLLTRSASPVVFILPPSESGDRAAMRPCEAGKFCDGEAKWRGRSSPLSFLHSMSRELNFAGAVTVALNPVTVPRLAKALSVIARTENVKIPQSTLVDLAYAASGDIRCAITSLQLIALHKSGMNAISRDPKPVQAKTRTASMCGMHANERPHPKGSSKFARRDNVLSTFHALGKILHNKRRFPLRDATQGPTCMEEENYVSALHLETSKCALPPLDALAQCECGTTAIHMHPTLLREQSFYDPEMILFTSRLSTVSAIDFLFENYAEFMHDSGIGDAALGLGYMSDASSLQLWSSAKCFKMDDQLSGVYEQSHFIDSNKIGENIAGSVITRGVLFAPDPSRPEIRKWFQLRPPQASRVFRAASKNLFELQKNVVTASGAAFTTGSNLASAGAEMLPMVRIIASTGSSGGVMVPYLPKRWVNMQGEVVADRCPQNSKPHASRSDSPQRGTSISAGTAGMHRSMGDYPSFQTLTSGQPTSEVDEIADW